MDVATPQVAILPALPIMLYLLLHTLERATMCVCTSQVCQQKRKRQKEGKKDENTNAVRTFALIASSAAFPPSIVDGLDGCMDGR